MKFVAKREWVELHWDFDFVMHISPKDYATLVVNAPPIAGPWQPDKVMPNEFRRKLVYRPQHNVAFDPDNALSVAFCVKCANGLWRWWAVSEDRHSNGVRAYDQRFGCDVTTLEEAQFRADEALQELGYVVLEPPMLGGKCLGVNKVVYYTRAPHGNFPVGTRCLASRPDGTELVLEFEDGTISRMGEDMFAHGLEDRWAIPRSPKTSCDVDEIIPRS